MKNRIQIKPEEFNESAWRLIGKNWMLITAQKEDKVNTMTASWGGFGVMWGKNVVFVVIRPQRYTKEFVDVSNKFSLSFLPPAYKKELGYLGSVSGRDENKIEKAKLTVEHIDGVPYFDEANTVVICEKLFAQPYDPNCFIDSEIDEKWYPKKDYHVLYVAEVKDICVTNE